MSRFRSDSAARSHPCWLGIGYLALAVAGAGCADDACLRNTDCTYGERCVLGRCALPAVNTDGGAGGLSAAMGDASLTDAEIPNGGGTSGVMGSAGDDRIQYPVFPEARPGSGSGGMDAGAGLPPATPDGGLSDAGADMDAAQPDAGQGMDAAVPDAALPDAGAGDDDDDDAGL